MRRPLPVALRRGHCLLALLAVLCTTPGRVQAQTDCTPVPSGYYEGYSSLMMRPYGPLVSAPPANASRSIEVASYGCTSDVLWYPEAVVQWQLVYGPHGLESKTTLVDGAVWTVSDFTYDADGHLATKEITGPGISGETTASYVTDELGRVVQRTQTVRVADFNALWPPGDADLRWSVAYQTDGVLAETFLRSMLVRRDRFDLDGRPLSTEVGFPASGTARLMLVFERDSTGALLGINRVWGDTAPVPADAGALAVGLGPRQIEQLPPVLERAEVLLLVGQPVTSTVTHGGILREVEDSYTDGCWLNETNAIEYDATGLVQGLEIYCICGDCVDAASDVDATGVQATVHHWTSGPWIRLDDAVDVAAEHPVMTPGGTRPAGSWWPEIGVLDASGAPRQLESVVTLAGSEPRLGINLRTDSGTFAAGGLLFASEPVTLCPPEEP